MGKWTQPNKHINGSKNPNWRGGKNQCVCKVCGSTYYKFLSQQNRSVYCSKRCFYARHPHNPVRDGKGYIWIFKPNHPNATPNGYIKEHRYVFEQTLGRYLKKTEVIHHKNKLRADNRLENLVLFETHAAHMRHHHGS